MPLVTVLINNYNYATYLPLAIDSALAQTYGEVEVVVVDDGSSDGSQDVLRSYGDRIVVVEKENGGQGSAVNAGYAVSTGDVVLVLDADDELLPEAAARVVEAMTEGVAKVHFRLRAVDAEGRDLGTTNPPARVRLAEGDVTELLLTTGRYATPVMSGNAYPRTVLQALLPMPEEPFRISADGYLVALAGLQGRVVAIEEPLGLYRLHGNNAWSSTTITPTRLASYVNHDIARNHELGRAAADKGLQMAPRAWRHDLSSLRSRVASRRLGGAGHPCPGDSLLTLGLVGAKHSLGLRSLGWSRRLSFAVWFLAVAWGPERVARRAVDWMYLPAVRTFTLPVPQSALKR